MNLETQVKNYDEAYRNGNALISDKKFDELEKKLFSLKPESDYFQQKLVLPSLEKIDVKEFMKGLSDDTEYILEPKIDGCAVAIKYLDGKINKAITRKGKDITEKIIRIKTVPLQVPLKSKLIVRGELYTKDMPCLISQGRSAGYLRSKSFDPDPKLTFAAFQIINGKLNQDDTIKYLKTIGFHTTKFYKNDINSFGHSINWILRYKHCLFSPTYPNEYPIDGWVLKINDYKLQQTRPCNWQIAIKF